jgi:predicted nucleic acid-binding protein
LFRSTKSSHENRRRRVARLGGGGGEIEAQVILLDPGEASCLALAISRGLVFVTDDLATRQLAQERDVRLTGTVGILLALARDGSLSLVEVSAILTEMIKQRYRSPVDRLDELV